MVLEAPKGQSLATGLFWPQAGVVSQSPGNPYQRDRSHPLAPRAPDPRGVGGFERAAATCADPGKEKKIMHNTHCAWPFFTVALQFALTF